jgi:hypothetical protein
MSILQVNVDGFLDVTFDSTTNGDSVIPTDLFLNILPGSENTLTRFKVDTTSYHPNGFNLASGYAAINPLATVHPSFGRPNLIRILFRTLDDSVDPPTSGYTITAGSYILWGIKT